jgi:hypothetical protein
MIIARERRPGKPCHPAHDPLLSGLEAIFGAQPYSACAAAPPDPTWRPGPQPCNQIGTLREQLARALRPRLNLTPRQPLHRYIRRVVMRALRKELPEAVEFLVNQIIAERNGAPRSPHP